MIKKITLMVLVAVLILSFCACNIPNEIVIPELTSSPSASPTPTAEPEVPVDGGVLNVAVSGIDTVNPLLTQNEDLRIYLGLVCEPLIQLDEMMNPVPNILTSWLSNTSYTLWEFKVLEDALFHDGKKITAWSVCNVINYAISVSGNNYQGNVDNISGCFAKDEYTVQIMLKEPDAQLPGKLFIPLVGDRTISADTPDKLVGSGIFVCTSFDSGKIVLSKNVEYRDESKLTRFDEIDINVMGSEKNKLATDSDITFVYGSTLGADALRDNTTVLYYEGSSYYYVAMNCSSTCLFGSNVTEGTTTKRNYITISNPMKQKSLRLALSYLISASTCITLAGSNHGIAAMLPLYSGTTYRKELTSEYTKNITMAEKLVKSCGYTYDHSKKTWFDENGEELIITALSSRDNFALKSIMRHVQDAFKTIGVRVDISELPDDDYVTGLLNKEYMIAAVTIDMGTYPSVEKILKTGSSLNFSYYSSTKMDDLLAQIRTLESGDVMIAAFNEVEKLVLEDAPILGLYYSQNAVILGPRIRGVRRDRLYPWNPLMNISEWWISQG